MKLRVSYFLLFVAVLLFSCGKSEKERAAFKLQTAMQIYEKGDTTMALLMTDSIRKLFPGAIQAIVDADQFKKRIYGDLLFRKQNELDSVLAGIDRLMKNFTPEKGEFDQYTQYVHNRQKFDSRWNKSYIKVHLDERGMLYISSNYYGDQWLGHTGIRVYDGDLQAKTDTVPVDSPLNHRSDFLSMKWEKVSYTEGSDNGVVEFVAGHAGRNLKAVFLGQRYYYIVLEEYDKQAIKDAFALSQLLRWKLRMEKEIKSIQTYVG